MEGVEFSVDLALDVKWLVPRLLSPMYTRWINFAWDPVVGPLMDSWPRFSRFYNPQASVESMDNK